MKAQKRRNLDIIVRGCTSDWTENNVTGASPGNTGIFQMKLGRSGNQWGNTHLCSQPVLTHRELLSSYWLSKTKNPHAPGDVIGRLCLLPKLCSPSTIFITVLVTSCLYDLLGRDGMRRNDDDDDH